MRESYGGSRSEPSGLGRLRKQVTETEEGLLELKRGKGKGDASVGRVGARGGERGGHDLKRQGT